MVGKLLSKFFDFILNNCSIITGKNWKQHSTFFIFSQEMSKVCDATISKEGDGYQLSSMVAFITFEEVYLWRLWSKNS